MRKFVAMCCLLATTGWLRADDLVGRAASLPVPAKAERHMRVTVEPTDLHGRIRDERPAELRFSPSDLPPDTRIDLSSLAVYPIDPASGAVTRLCVAAAVVRRRDPLRISRVRAEHQRYRRQASPLCDLSPMGRLLQPQRQRTRRPACLAAHATRKSGIRLRNPLSARGRTRTAEPARASRPRPASPRFRR